MKRQHILCENCGQVVTIAEQGRDWLVIGLMALAWGAVLAGCVEIALNKGPKHELRGVEILRKYDDYRFLLRVNGDEFPVWFCRDYKPDLVPGCYLTKLTYTELPIGNDHTCWSVVGHNGSYIYLQDKLTGDDITKDGKKCFDAKLDMPVSQQ